MEYVRYEESTRWERERSFLAAETLKEDVLEIGRVVLLGDFNASVGKSTDVDGIFGEDTCGNSSLVDGVCPSLGGRRAYTRSQSVIAYKTVEEVW